MNRIAKSMLAVAVLAWIAPVCADESGPATGWIAIRQEADLPQALSGPQLRQALATRIPGAAWNGEPLRGVLREFGATSRVAIVRDRRIDPTRPVTLSLQQQSREEILAAIAKAADAEVRLVGNVVYAGPPEPAGLIRTLAALRQKDLAHPTALGSRRSAVRQTVRWGDLSPPKDILKRIAEAFNVTVANPERIPHDLWEGAVLPEMTCAEMLTVVLVQFDLTFTWDPASDAIRLVPLPTTREDRAAIAIERSYRPPPAKRDDVADWIEQHPDVTATSIRGRIIVRARVERHEQLARRLGDSAPTEAEPTPAAPLERRRFTLTVKGVPAQAIVDQLKSSGITFEYDKKTLEAAGVDFATPVSIDVKSAGPDVFLKALFDPLGLDFEYSGTNVVLKPKE